MGQGWSQPVQHSYPSHKLPALPQWTATRCATSQREPGCRWGPKPLPTNQQEKLCCLSPLLSGIRGMGDSSPMARGRECLSPSAGRCTRPCNTWDSTRMPLTDWQVSPRGGGIALSSSVLIMWCEPCQGMFAIFLLLGTMPNANKASPQLAPGALQWRCL